MKEKSGGKVKYRKRLLWLAIFLFISLNFIYAFFPWDISDFWLSLREPREVRNAAQLLRSRGFRVTTVSPVYPIFYELGLERPRWRCTNWSHTQIQIEPLEDIQRSLEIINPMMFTWRHDERFGDREMAIVRNFSNLKWLVINNTSVTDKSAEYLALPPNLFFVNADHTAITENFIFELDRHRFYDNSMGFQLLNCKFDRSKLGDIREIGTRRNWYYEL